MKNKINFWTKLIFLFKKTPCVVIIGDNKEKVKEKTLEILNQKNKEFLIFTADNEDINDFSFFLQRSKRPIFVVTEISAIRKNVLNLLESLSYKTKLVINSDNNISQKAEKITGLKAKKYGFNEESHIKALQNEDFLKISYKGSIVPVWIEKRNKNKVYPILAAIAITTSLGLNLVKISQVFKKNKA